MNVWFHTYFLSLCYIYFIRQVYKCRGCFDSIEHQFPSGRWSCLPWSLPRAGSGHVPWSRDLSPLETRDTWPDPWSDIDSVIASQRKCLLILHYDAEFPILHQWTSLVFDSVRIDIIRRGIFDIWRLFVWEPGNIILRFISDGMCFGSVLICW